MPEQALPGLGDPGGVEFDGHLRHLAFGGDFRVVRNRVRNITQYVENGPNVTGTHCAVGEGLREGGMLRFHLLAGDIVERGGCAHLRASAGGLGDPQVLIEEMHLGPVAHLAMEISIGDLDQLPIPGEGQPGNRAFRGLCNLQQVVIGASREINCAQLVEHRVQPGNQCCWL